MKVQGSPIAGAVLSVVLLTVLSGCLGADDEVAPGEDGKNPGPKKTDTVFDEETGAVWGAVSTDSFMPIEGARAQLLTTARTLTDHEAETGEDGEFVVPFVEPGKYIVHVSAVGFEAEQRQVIVDAGGMSEIRLVMAPLPNLGPYASEFDRTGFINTAPSWQVEPPVVGCQETPLYSTCSGFRLGGEGGETRVGPVRSVPGWTSAVREEDYMQDEMNDLKTIIVELRWTPAGPFGETFLFDFMCSDTPRGGGGAVLDREHDCYFDARGTGPLVHRVDEEHWLELGYNHTGTWAARVFGTYGMLGTYDLVGVDIGLAYQQSFDKYWTVFHGEPAPADYTRMPDA